MGARALAGASLLCVAAVGSTFASGDGAHALCGSCHLESFGGVSSQDRPSLARACARCHEVELAPGGWGEAAFQAARTFGHTRLHCLDCHTGHASGRPYQLRDVTATEAHLDAVSSLCVVCHAETAQTRAPLGYYVRHPVGVSVGAPARTLQAGLGGIHLPLVDIRGTQAPEDDVIACSTCHAIHGSRGPFLLRWTRRETPRACCQCHDTCETSAPQPWAAYLARRGPAPRRDAGPDRSTRTRIRPAWRQP